MRTNAAVAAATATEAATEAAARDAFYAARDAAKANRTPETMAAAEAAAVEYLRVTDTADGPCDDPHAATCMHGPACAAPHIDAHKVTSTAPAATLVPDAAAWGTFYGNAQPSIVTGPRIVHGRYV
jgi:hypothetical protein